MKSMAEEQGSPYPLAPANTYTRNDAEAPTAALNGHATVYHRNKPNRKKCLLYVLLFLLFQTGIILLFTLIVMKIRTPKFRIHSASFHDFIDSTAPNPFVNATINAELAVKNTNFGRFKFESSNMSLFYRGTEVGRVLVPKGRSNWRSTKKFKVMVDMRIDSDELAKDLTTGIVRINSRAKLRGNVRLMMVFKKKRSSDMDCSMDIVVASREMQNIVCK